ncbi:MAG: polynucleotide adenylyltransferase PcnB, partial [Methylibium sp.]|nr:polynucleotide adenylyltransferase PcnB [Methylibium sp.]
SGRGKLGADMREIWLMQPRFERRTGSTPLSLIEQPRFRAGFDFLRLRADTGEVPIELAEWWEDFSLGTDEERIALLQLAREQQQPRRVTGAGRAAPRASEGSSPESADEAGDEAGDVPAAKKRRRRRRKPGGASVGESAGAPADTHGES